MLTRWDKTQVILKYTRSWITHPVAFAAISGLQASFIAAYPRSGSTWLRTMITSVRIPESDGDPAVFNRVIPGVTPEGLGRVYHAPKPRLLMTHSTFRRRIGRAVYVIRDGRDSLSSFFHYTTTRAGKPMPFSDWLTLYFRGYYGPRWDQNVESWLITGREALGNNLLVVRHEDLKADSLGSLETVCRFLEMDTSKEALERAVDAVSLENGRKWERHYRGKQTDPNASFYRGGRTGQWHELLSNEEADRFMSVSERALKLGGYL